MAQRGVFQLFIPVLWKHFKKTYPFISRFGKSFCVAIPKSSSFYLGVSPNYNKHVIINFQHSPKPWGVGEFTVNVHISTELSVTENWTASSENYEQFNDGYYRLASVTGHQDRWWCLRAADPIYKPRNVLRPYWEPSSYESQDVVFNEAIEDISRFLEDTLFKKAGYLL